MKYDDASWHSEGDFPDDLEEDAAATHIGMFFAWCALNGMLGELHLAEPSNFTRLQKREITPGQYLLSDCDGKLTDEDLNDEGNQFCADYFHDEDTGYGLYVDDYHDLADGLPSMYHVPDTWDTFDKLAPLIAEQYALFKED